jgi:hypothetical protein
MNANSLLASLEDPTCVIIALQTTVWFPFNGLLRTMNANSLLASLEDPTRVSIALQPTVWFPFNRVL